MTTTDQQESGEQLPPGVADRLRGAARRRTEGIPPFPAVTLAVRRDRRRRAAVTACATAAVLVTATVAVGAVRSDHAPEPADRGSGPTPAPTASATSTGSPAPAEEPFEWNGRTAGSLADDSAWLRGMRQQAREEGKAGQRATNTRVLWATDHGGARYAMTVASNSARDVTTGVSETTWWVDSWRGAAGAAPSAMTSVGQMLWGSGGGTEYQVFRKAGDETGRGVLVVLGKGLTEVQVGSPVTYSADGKVSTTFHGLQHEGAVWWGAATPSELGTLRVRATFPDGRWHSVGGTGTPAPGLSPDLFTGAAPATANTGVLACAATSFDTERTGFPADSTPVLGRTVERNGQWYGVTVARAARGGHLVGACRTRHPEWDVSGAETAAGFVVPSPPGGPDKLLAVVPVQPGQPAADAKARTATTLLAIAPVGAAEVTFGEVTAPVHDRLAIIDFPDRTSIDGLTVTARGADGTVLGTARTAPAREALEAVFYGVAVGRPPRFVTPTNLPSPTR